jgi:hypothetical protein
MAVVKAAMLRKASSSPSVNGVCLLIARYF